MASPASPASSASSIASATRDGAPQTLQDLVGHFLAAKRSLITQTTLVRASDIVTAARELLEENAVSAARNTALAGIVDEQVDALEAVRRGIDAVEAEVEAEFKQLLHDVDASFAGLESTLAVLRSTPIEPVLQPPGSAQKHLFDFIDSATVTSLNTAFRACIDGYQEARLALNDSNDAFDTSLENLQSSIDNVPRVPVSASTPSPIPSLYHQLETHAKEAAQNFQSLVRHYDACVTALRHTEGGSAAATQAAGDAPVAAGDDDLSAPPEPMSEEERHEMLSVLAKDAHEVDDVVADIRDHGAEMELLLSHIDSHIAHLRNEGSALNSILRVIAGIAVEAKLHVRTSRTFHASWLQDTRPTLMSGIEECESQRDFYERFDLAYAELLVEVASRRRRHERAKRKADEAQKELDRLHADDERSREQFTAAHGDFLPLDIWPGLRDPPRRYQVRPLTSGTADAEEGDEEHEDDAAVQSIPQLSRHVVERALTRVKRRM